ncbi:hypothetical protein [Streptomyces cyaneofuscatus]|uniref:hypothetical protein n=1 Tax=Streptomyces cyaneofuscatus TaxID=66883 RepID=UPI002FF1BFD4
MADDPIKSALLSLTAKTTTGQLREMLPLIEQKLAAGVKHEEILEVLNAHGLNLTLGSYKTMLYRIRQRSQKATGTAQLDIPGERPTGPVKTGKEPEASPAASMSVEAKPSAGKTRTQAVLENETPAFSFKQMQQKSKG